MRECFILPPLLQIQKIEITPIIYLEILLLNLKQQLLPSKYFTFCFRELLVNDIEPFFVSYSSDTYTNQLQ